MDIEAAIETIKWKHWEHTFSESDAAELCDLAAQYPCHLALRLLLIECAHYEQFFPHSWRVYYQATIDRGSECWPPQQLAEIYLLGAHLYLYDQDKRLNEEATRKAFELAPHYWRAILAYLSRFRDELPPADRLALIERLGQAQPDHPNGYFAQALYFEEYVAQAGGSRYRKAAIQAYQKALEMSQTIRWDVPNRVMEAAIKRLSEMADS